ncbi:MAG: M14 family zinc carboxypeptidase [Candidatus Saccharimonadales bacterium]
MLKVELRSQRSAQRDFAELEATYSKIVGAQKHKLDLQAKHTPLGKFLLNVRHHRLRISLIAGGTLATFTIFFILYMIFLPVSLRYVFAQQKNCVSSPLIFPSVFKNDSHGVFTLSRTSTVSIGHTTIFSSKLCATPEQSPLPSTVYMNHQWMSIAGIHIGKSIKVDTGYYPVADESSLGNKAVPTEKPLLFKLNIPDATFNYAMAANDKTSTCSKQKTSLSCNLVPLKLAYAASYKASLVRVFHGHIAGTVLSKTLQTITATAITQTSIGQGVTVYNSPQQIIINTDKAITNLQPVSLSYKNASGAITNIPITASFKGQTITVNFASALPRQESFDLHINNLTASDDSSLEQPYNLTFTTSGGPAVIGSNIPSYGLASGQAMVVSFDQVLNPSQDPSQFVSLLVNGATQPDTISITGQHITIRPTNSYPVCASVTVRLSPIVQNAYGISGNSTWSYTSRSHCYTTFNIGTSVKGRGITAYQFGSGPSMVLYIAAMEGNEQNSANLLQQWIPIIDANPGKIPSYRTLVIIPQINPDGYAANTRLNANGIDLNRNFPSNNWQTQVTEPLANTVLTNDGGPNPLSEPESQALANFYQGHRPRLTLTMHSHGGIVEANDAGDSDALGSEYASLADYRAIPTYAIGNFFNYTTTGAFEDWANDKLGLPVLEVELLSPTNSEYSRNLPALWAMAQVSP